MTPEQKTMATTLFIQYILPVLFSALATLLGWVFVQLGRRLSAQAGESKLAAAFAQLAHWGDVVVADLEATLRPELGKAAADGKLTKEEIAQLRAVALARLKALAGSGLSGILGNLGVAGDQTENYLSGVIERAVDRLPASPSRPIR